MSQILIIGATSAIAQASARLWAGQGHGFYLVARDGERLAALAADLGIRGAASAHTQVLDLLDLAHHQALIDAAFATLGPIDIALIAHGTLGDQQAAQADFQLALHQLNANAISQMSLLTHLANRMEAQGRGNITVISSVAGERGRQSNYVYGAAKGALTLFLQGLRQRLYPAGVTVLTIKPGLVDTPMTQDFQKGWLWASPEQIARRILKGVAQGREVLYAPWYWRLVMGVIRQIPEALFKRIRL